MKKSIKLSQLSINLKQNVFYCNISGGYFGTKETIQEILKLLNLKITTIDYVNMEIKYEKISIAFSDTKW